LGDEDKNFEASAQKLQKAREQGQVIKSKDLTTALFVVVMFFMLILMGPYIWQVMSETFIAYFEQIPNKTIENIGWQYLLLITLRAFALIVAPFLGVAFFISVLAEMMQVGILLTLQPIMPKFDKLNPVKGFQNIFSKRTVIELVKNILKVSILGYMAYMVFNKHLAKIIGIASADNVFAILQVLGEILTEFIFLSAMGFFALGAFDYLYQRNKFLGDQKMSMKEVKDEYKQQEGDPHVKAALRQKRMQMAMRRMLEAVPTADVITTNPIHVAVALKYDPDKSEAPMVVAKGAEKFAEEIKKIAKKHAIPIVENKTVAQTLYKVVDLDRDIPPELYQAVAEILMFAWQQVGKPPPTKTQKPPL
jgi:flagellar biosynthetic protein FlhB